MKTVVWKGLDEPRMEVTHIESFERATGTQIGHSYEVRWELERDSLSVSLVGGPTRTFQLGDADYFDLLHSPFFNSLPVVRDKLLSTAAPHDYVMQFVRFPELSVEKVEQRYTPLSGARVRYESRGFTADIDFDDDLLVRLYHGYLERLG